MTTFTPAPDCPKELVFQALLSGTYDYTPIYVSANFSKEALWENEQKNEDWPKDYVQGGHGTVEDARKMFFDTLHFFDRDSLLEGAQLGETWAVDSGYVLEGWRYLRCFYGSIF
ncbi:hypothetical protein [Acinetobacter sp. YH16057]|uniref:hypothetical protein n=1 Tax=Acinetobacter sp. YH16057 TaxID=2601195 RepID=UPI0015D40E29|nr:hypothetical protein [Acinetobacter sp. YH16057]